MLRTDRKDFTKVELWNLCMTLARAEEGFKALKSDLGLRPNHHQLEERVDAHVFVTVLAYQLLSYIRKALESTGDNRQWETIRQVLRTHCYATVILPASDGTARHIRKAGTPEACQQKIYDLFNINLKKLQIKRITVESKKSRYCSDYRNAIVAVEQLTNQYAKPGLKIIKIAAGDGVGDIEIIG